MSIEKEYADKIEEIKQASDKLSEWEEGFFFGSADSQPVGDRDVLSISQKSIIDRVYKERVLGKGREKVTEVKFKSDRVIATKMETNLFHVSIDGTQIGPPISQKEATAIVGWLSETIDTLTPIDDEAVEKFPGE